MKSVTFIGSGNVAWHLARVMHTAGYEIRCVWSRTMDSAEKLASLVNARPVTELADIEAGDDIYVLCLNDEALPSIAAKLRFQESLVVHTSGTLSIDILQGMSGNAGVLYPLQTLTKGVSVDISAVPFFIEASSGSSMQEMEELAASLSARVYKANSRQRLQLHMAAVFACNYSNFMYTMAADLLSDSGFNFEVLSPLIAETTHKAINTGSLAAQTGPARRGDFNVIRKHIGLLASKPEYAEIYRLIARMIINRYHPGILNDAEL